MVSSAVSSQYPQVSNIQKKKNVFVLDTYRLLFLSIKENFNYVYMCVVGEGGSVHLSAVPVNPITGQGEPVMWVLGAELGSLL